jgi:hypothetical protein
MDPTWLATGNWSGFAPLIILSTKTAARRHNGTTSTPYAIKPPASASSGDPIEASRCPLARSTIASEPER